MGRNILAKLKLNDDLHKEKSRLNWRGKLHFIESDTLESFPIKDAPDIGWTADSLQQIIIPDWLYHLQGGFYLDDWFIGEIDATH